MLRYQLLTIDSLTECVMRPAERMNKRTNERTNALRYEWGDRRRLQSSFRTYLPQRGRPFREGNSAN